MGLRPIIPPVRHDVVQAQLDAVLTVVDTALEAGTTLGIYLYGSAVTGGLRADSDLDLLVVTSRRSTSGEKRRLVDGLMPISGAKIRPPGWRPLEVTLVVQSDVRPWRYPPRWDLQYGEWLRQQFADGELEPWPPTNPDLAVLITMVLESARPLRGPAAGQLLDPVPQQDLVRAMVDEISQLLGDLESDTRNVLLTLARIWSTAATGAIHSKDAAADWALARLPPEHRPVLARARALYLGGGYGPWEDPAAIQAHVDVVLGEIRRLSRAAAATS